MESTPRMRTALPALAIVLAVLATGPIAAAEEAAQPPQPEHARASLVAEDTELQAGVPSRLGLHFEMDPHWHVYWRNPGSSGQEPTVTWLVPDGFVVSEIRWPAPTRHVLGDLAGFIYEGEVLLPVEITPPEDFVGDARIRVLVEWLVCEDSAGCIPGEAALEITLPVVDEAPTSDERHASQFATATSTLPTQLPADAVAFEDAGRHIVMRVKRKPQWRGETTFTFFPYAWDVIEFAAPQPAALVDGVVEMRLERTPRSKVLSVDGVLVAKTGALTEAYRVGAKPDTEVEHATEADWTTAVEAKNALLSTTPIDFEAYGGASSAGPTSLWFALLAALLGGLILNLMPCVLPVLSLKILGFIGQAGDDPKQIRKYGSAFGAGVLVTFWALAGVLVLLRAGGEQLGWGFQLQEPKFVAAMTFLFLGMSLNLLGVFEVGLGLMSAAGRTQDRIEGTGVGASFANGVLATLIATPCTAPFMGGALGFTLDKPLYVGFAVFTALGLGMAAPYILLSWFPQWLEKLPRPGPWMDTFKKVMAIPLLLTAVWLVWLFGKLVGDSGLWLLGGGLAVAAVGFYCFGRFGQRGSTPRIRHGVGHALAAALVLGGALLSFAAKPGPATAAPLTADGFWVPFDPQRIEQLRAQGRPVFIDFTADWCLTCKFNEKTFIDVPEIHALVAEHGYVMMKADWTKQDPVITKTLARFRRGSVPLYVLYSPDPARRPIVLPEAITTSLLEGAMHHALSEDSDTLAP